MRGCGTGREFHYVEFVAAGSAAAAAFAPAFIVVVTLQFAGCGY